MAVRAALVPFPAPARPTISVKKMALFCNPASGALQLSCIDGQITAVAKAKVFSNLGSGLGKSRVKAAPRNLALSSSTYVWCIEFK